MKSIPFILSLFFAFMVIHPSKTFHAANSGLLLWFQIILPTLFPFTLISNLLFSTNTVFYISKILHPFLFPVFKSSPYGSFAILSGFLCGYPVGSKVISDLLSQKKISKNEASYLLSFCNNTSPSFITNYIVLNGLGDKALIFPSLLILYLSPVVCSFLFRLIYKPSSWLKNPDPSCPKYKTHFHFEMFDHCIMNAFEVITKIGGYIIAFSILLSFLQSIPISLKIWKIVFLPSLEITNGISFLCHSKLWFPLKYLLILCLTSFGGLCSIAQTKCMIQDSGLEIFPYILEKLVTTFVTSLFAILYLIFCFFCLNFSF